MIAEWFGRTVALIGALSASPAVHPASTLDPTLKRIEREAMRTVRSKRIVGSVLMIIHNGDIAYARGYGLADVETRRLISPDTPMLAGEFTKLITAMTVMRLVEQGLVDLDKAVTAYVPDVCFGGRAVDAPAPTVRHLLTHHGGLVNSRFQGALVNRVRDISPLSCFERSNPPGLVYVYSHQGYVLLGTLVAQLTGRSFADAARSLVLDPLGMNHSTFTPPPNRARPHNRAERPRPEYYVRDQSALGMYSTGRDLARLMLWWLGDDPAPMSEVSRAEMVRVQNASVALDIENQTGLAWQLTNTGDHRTDRVLRLESVLPYFRGAMTLLPEIDAGVLVLSNSSASGDYSIDITQSAADQLIEHFTQRSPPQGDEDAPIGLPGDAQTAAMESRYNTGFGLIELTAEEEGSFGMKFLGRQFGLDPRADGWYALSYRLFGLIDIRISVLAEVLLRPVVVGDVKGLLARYGNGSFLFGTAFDVVDFPQTNQLIGTYELVGNDRMASELKLTTIELVVSGGLLRAVYSLPYDVDINPQAPLLPAGPNRLVIPGLGTNMGGLVRVRHGAGGATELEYLGWVFRRQ